MNSDLNPLCLLEVSLIEGVGEISCQEPSDGTEEVDPLAIGGASDETINDNVVINGVENCHRSPELMVEQNINKLSEVSPEEWNFRWTTYPNLNSDVSIVCKKRLHCTVCNEHIGCSVDLDCQHLVHPLLKVLICPRCLFKYNHISFPLNTRGMDVRCRWCGQTVKSSFPDRPNSLKNCSICPFAFCEHCIYLNLVSDYSLDWNDWVCFVCRNTALWPHRALAWALVTILCNLASSGIERSSISKDISTCCRRKKHPSIVRTNKLRKLAPKPSPKEINSNNLPTVQGVTKYQLVQGPPLPAPPPTPPVHLSVLPPARTNICWFKNAIGYILENITMLEHQIKLIVDSVSDDESDINLSSKVETIHKLVLVTTEHLQNNGKALMTDWNARKSIVSCRSIASLLTIPEHTSTETVVQNKDQVLEVKISTGDSVGPLEKKVNAKNRKRPAKQSNSVEQLLPRVPPKMTRGLCKKYNLKGCYVRLTKSSNLYGDSVVFS